MYAFAAFTVVVSCVSDWRAYFARPEDVVSALTIPVVPSLVYAALLAVMGAALRRRIRAAWWLTFVWWLVIPWLARIAFLAQEFDLASVIGLVLVGAAIVLAWRVRYQFVVRHVAGSLRAALAIFVVGGAVVLVVGALLVGRFGAQRQRRRDPALRAQADDVGDRSARQRRHRRLGAALGARGHRRARRLSSSCCRR